MEFEKRFDDDGEPINCDCCGFDGRLSMFKDTHIQGGNKEDLWLCEVCANTGLSSARKYPNQCSDPSLYRAIAQLGNLLLEEIRSGSKSDSQTPFPWGDTRVLGRLRNARHWRNDRPSTFEELILIGRSSLSDGSSGLTRNIGKTAFASLDPIFEQYGFGKQWMLS